MTPKEQIDAATFVAARRDLNLTVAQLQYVAGQAALRVLRERLVVKMTKYSNHLSAMAILDALITELE